ncbi:ATP-binding protein [Massilia sp. 2TAF26]|uniref:ATP-binding protein n=1 Tax=Massilia sp. 2TAF26 TaxID=3233012 RepID=UPI003F9D74F3
MRTIRSQLLLGLVGGTLACTVLAGGAIYFKVLEESNELFDYQLRQMATTLPTTQAASPARRQHGDPEEEVVIQVWDRNGRLKYISTAEHGLPAAARPGYSTLAGGDDRWRVYLAEREGDRVQVAQSVSAREELAARLALRSLLPFLAMLPILGVLIYAVVGRSLKPLNRLAQALGRRSPSDLQPLAERDQPPELKPVVAAMDDLLLRLDHALHSQRAFVADAAHELRSPLTALQLQLQLAERATDGAQRAVAFTKLHQRLDRAIRLVQQLLTAARQEGGTADAAPAPVDLLELARACIGERYDQASARRIDLGIVESETDPGGPSLSGNADSLHILIGNLLDNALRYTPSGGRVDVTVAHTGQEVLLQVADDGIGIPPAERERVFDRFYRGAGHAEWGSGLGLSIVRSVANAHGATVTLGDGPTGRGLLVTVRFRISGTLVR